MHTYRHTYILTDGQTDIQTYRDAAIVTYRHFHILTNKQRHADIFTY